MKIGPIHIIKRFTFDRLRKSERLWHHFSSELANAEKQGNPLAARVLEHTHGLLHSPLSARFAPTVKPTGKISPRSRQAAERVVMAYRKTKADSAAPPAASMWDALTADRREFVTALEAGNVPAVQGMLEKLFVSPLVHGLGQVHISHLEILDEPITHLGFHFTDTLISLAEAVGAIRVSCMGQDAPGHLRPLHRDLDAIMTMLQPRLGFEPGYEDVCSAFGFRVAGRLCTIDSLTHAYAAYRLKQLGAGLRECVFELGGGYGGLALMAHRAGIGRYAIFDLPWVNALQGYYLIVNLPENAVRLHGESAGNYRVEPYWQLYAEKENACDFSANSDSLPEMGHATALDYLKHLHRVTGKLFLSINQEAKAHYGGAEPQNCVRELNELFRGFRCLSRQRHWLRQGYIEEVFEPIR
jgi:hypothetical protein